MMMMTVIVQFTDMMMFTTGYLASLPMGRHCLLLWSCIKVFIFVSVQCTAWWAITITINMDITIIITNVNNQSLTKSQVRCCTSWWGRRVSLLV